MPVTIVVFESLFVTEIDISVQRVGFHNRLEHKVEKHVFFSTIFYPECI